MPSPTLRFLVFSFVMLALASVARASNPYQVDADAILTYEHQFQDQVMYANKADVQATFQITADVERFLKSPQMRMIQSEADRNVQSFLTKVVANLKKIEDAQKTFEDDLASSLKAAAPVDFDFESFGESRMAGIKLIETPSLALYNGPMLRKPEAPKQEIGGPGISAATAVLGTATREMCFYDPSPTDDILSFFMAQHANNMSCMYKPDSARLIPDPVDALNEKILV